MVCPSDDHPRVQDAVRVERGLEAAHQLNLQRILAGMQLRTLGPADPVLGTDRAAKLLDQVEDPTLKLLLTRARKIDRVGRQHDIEVQIAVADMAERYELAP